MLNIFKEIESKVTERMYFHDVPKNTEMKEVSKAVGYVKKVEVLTLAEYVEVTPEQIELYKKILTKEKYGVRDVHFTLTEKRWLYEKSLEDHKYELLAKYLFKNTYLDKDLKHEILTEMKETVDSLNKVRWDESNYLVTLDDGLSEVKGVTDQEVVQGKVYEVELGKGHYGEENVLNLYSGMEDLYSIKKIKEI